MEQQLQLQQFAVRSPRTSPRLVPESRLRLIEYQKAELQGYIDTVEAEKEHMIQQSEERKKVEQLVRERLLPEVAAQTEALARLRDHGKQVLENQLAALRGSAIFSSASISQICVTYNYRETSWH